MVIPDRRILISPATLRQRSVAFFNPMAYKIRTQPVRFDRSDGFGFSSDLVTFRAVARMDGDLLDNTATTGAVLDTD